MSEVTFNLMDRIKARVIAGLHREVSVPKDTTKDDLQRLVTLIASNRWYMINSEETVLSVWNDLNENDRVSDLVFGLVSDVKEEVVFGFTAANPAEPPVQHVNNSLRNWKVFCEALALIFEPMSTASNVATVRFAVEGNTPQGTQRGKSLLGERAGENFKFSTVLECNAWLTVLLLLSLIPKETIMSASGMRGQSNAGRQ